MQIISRYHRSAVVFSLELSLALMQIASHRDTRAMKVRGTTERERKVTVVNNGGGDMGLGVMQVTNLCMTTPGSDMLAVPGRRELCSQGSRGI